jgi:hypothetical protein
MLRNANLEERLSEPGESLWARLRNMTPLHFCDEVPTQTRSDIREALGIREDVAIGTVVTGVAPKLAERLEAAGSPRDCAVLVRVGQGLHSPLHEVLAQAQPRH